jgi:hypothetical protein
VARTEPIRKDGGFLGVKNKRRSFTTSKMTWHWKQDRAAYPAHGKLSLASLRLLLSIASMIQSPNSKGTENRKTMLDGLGADHPAKRIGSLISGQLGDYAQQTRRIGRDFLTGLKAYARRPPISWPRNPGHRILTTALRKDLPHGRSLKNETGPQGRQNRLPHLGLGQIFQAQPASAPACRGLD